MTDPETDARAILEAIQSAVDARVTDGLVSLFDERAVLIGTQGDGRNSDGLRRYLSAVVTQPVSLRWEWQDIVPFHHSAGSLGFAAFGEIVVSDSDGERRAPIRLTLFAVQTPNGWRSREFHGSIPSDF